jgi:CRISPR-associated endonuclease Cas2
MKNLQQTFYLVMYDITHPKSLQKVAKVMLKTGFVRINKSVWLGNTHPVTSPEVHEKLEKLLEIPESKGSLYYILPVGKATVKKIMDWKGKKPKQLDYWVGERHTQFL